MKKSKSHVVATHIVTGQPMIDAKHAGNGVAVPPTHDQIASRAYHIYESHGRVKGQCKQNWKQAEHELGTNTRRP